MRSKKKDYEVNESTIGSRFDIIATAIKELDDLCGKKADKNTLTLMTKDFFDKLVDEYLNHYFDGKYEFGMAFPEDEAYRFLGFDPMKILQDRNKKYDASQSRRPS